MNLKRNLEGKLPILNIQFMKLFIRLISTDNINATIQMKKTVLNNKLRSELLCTNQIVYNSNIKINPSRYVIMSGLVNLVKD